MMRPRWLLLLPLPGLHACEPPRPAAYARYQPSVASETWCRLGEGAYAFVSRPEVEPSLVGFRCTAPRRAPLPEMERPGSTFAELVVEPGASIEIPVELPEALQGVGCRLDSVLIPHGQRTSDIALEIASAGGVVPIVSYEQLPPPREEGVAPRTVGDNSSARRAIWAPDTPPGENPVSAIADPELWPTGATLRLDGGRTADGAARVVFETEPEPEPEPEKPEEPAGPALDSHSPDGAPSPDALSPALPSPADTPSGTALTPPSAPPPNPPNEPAPPEGADAPAPTAPAVRQPRSLELIAYRHQIAIEAPNAFSIVLRARERPFGIGVRSDRESPDPRLSYRAPGTRELTPTHLVPQVAVVVSRCGRPFDEILRDLQ